jgi:hypothetical protein
MKHQFAGEQQLRATVALLGVADVSIHAVLPGFFRYSWPCGCEVVTEAGQREWSACLRHEASDLLDVRHRHTA